MAAVTVETTGDEPTSLVRMYEIQASLTTPQVANKASVQDRADREAGKPHLDVVVERELVGVCHAAAPRRVLCALVALAAGIVGVAMLVAPGSTGTYFSWAAFLAILAGCAAARAGSRDTRLPLLALVLWPLAALIAASVHLDELRSGFPAVSYLAALSVFAGLAGLVMCSPRGYRC